MMSAHTIFDMYLDYLEEEDFIGMDMCRKFLEMGLLDQDVMLIIKMATNMTRIITSNPKNQII